MASSDYNWWRQALKLAGGDCRELTRDQLALLGVSEDKPESGFFRNRVFKGGALVPVAIWPGTDGKLVCLQGGEETDALRVWSYACRNPITEALYHAVLAGGAWPDEPPAVTKEHNLPAKTGDDAVDLLAEFEAEKELATTFLKKPVTTQQQADQIAVWKKKISGIVSSADGSFDIEKKPWRDGGKKVDDRWRWRADAEALVKSLNRANEAWLKELDRLEQERQRKAREEAAKIQRDAEEAEKRAAEAALAAERFPAVGSTFAAEAEAEADRLAQKAKDAAREAQARPVFAGRTGSKQSLHTYQVAEITDYDALLQALKNEPEVREVVEKIAGRIARTAGAPLPAGMNRKEEKRAA